MAVTVLVVDDQERFRRVARTVVEACEGFAVTCEADSGEVSVELARRRHPDLVLMDLHLPGIDGLEACRRILAQRGAAPVVLLLSVDACPEYVADARAAGAAAFSPKSELTPGWLVATWDAAQRNTTRGTQR